MDALRNSLEGKRNLEDWRFARRVVGDKRHNPVIHGTTVPDLRDVGSLGPQWSFVTRLEDGGKSSSPTAVKWRGLYRASTATCMR